MSSALVAAPFASPHLLPTYRALAARAELDVTLACLRPLPASRLASGWAELAEVEPDILQPWRRAGDRRAFRRALRTSDVALLPGPFHFRSSPGPLWVRLREGRPVATWSEPPLSLRRRSLPNRLALAAVAHALDSPLVHLLAVGDRAAGEFAELGARQWTAWSFAHAVAPVEEEPPPRGRGDTLRLVYAGRLEPIKGVDLLVDALAAPELAVSAWTLDLVGDGSLAGALRERVRRLRLGERVRFHGRLELAACAAVQRAADVLVLPSRFDGWGAVVNEACEQGLAVVATDAVGAARLLRASAPELVVPAGDPRALAAAIAGLLRDRARLEAAGRANREAVRSVRPAALAGRLAGLLSDLASGRPPSEGSTGLRLVADGGGAAAALPLSSPPRAGGPT